MPGATPLPGGRSVLILGSYFTMLRAELGFYAACLNLAYPVRLDRGLMPILPVQAG